MSESDTREGDQVLNGENTNSNKKNESGSLNLGLFTSSRINIWKEFFVRIKWFGQKKEYFYISGYGQGSTNLAHNIYLQIGSDLGGIGAIIFLLLNMLLIWDVLYSLLRNPLQYESKKTILLYQILILIYFNIYGFLYSNNYIYGSISYYLFLISLGLHNSKSYGTKSVTHLKNPRFTR